MKKYLIPFTLTKRNVIDVDLIYRHALKYIVQKNYDYEVPMFSLKRFSLRNSDIQKVDKFIDLEIKRLIQEGQPIKITSILYNYFKIFNIILRQQNI